MGKGDDLRAMSRLAGDAAELARAGQVAAQMMALGALRAEMQALGALMPGAAASSDGVTDAAIEARRRAEEAEIEAGFDNMPV